MLTNMFLSIGFVMTCRMKRKSKKRLKFILHGKRFLCRSIRKNIIIEKECRQPRRTSLLCLHERLGKKECPGSSDGKIVMTDETELRSLFI